MDDLLPIGRFAHLTQLTVKALRLYDELGLLRPAVVDFKTGFRYYRPDQVTTARRIRLLRSLDMPLADIKVLLQASDPAAVRIHLAGHRQRLEERIAGYRRALALLKTLDERGEETRKERSMERESKPYQCSFCGKPNGEVERMIAGPNGVFICNECVERCNEIIARERAQATAQ